MLEIKFKQLLKTLSINHKIILTFQFFIGNSLFLCVSERESIVFRILNAKKWDAHFRASHFLYFMEEDYFFQVTDLQFWETLFSIPFIVDTLILPIS